MAPGSAPASPRRRGTAACAAALAGALLLLLLRPHATPPRLQPAPESGDTAAAAASTPPGTRAADATQAASRGSAGSGGRYEMLDGVELVWHKPSGRPVGVLFAAHGCSHSATDWLPPSAACPSCLGLPEELGIARVATAKGLVLVAASSADRGGSRCWDASVGSVDMLQVKKALGQLMAREGLEKLPVYALGASSGGAFVLALAAEMKLGGVCSEIMAHPRLAKLVQAAKASFGSYPPTAFVHMPRDARTARVVGANAGTLRDQGVPVRVFEVRPSPVTAKWLAAKVPELRSGQCTAAAVVGALTEAGILGPNGDLTSNPRSNDWRAVVSAAPGCKGVPMGADVSALSEVLNLAWAGHEIVSDHVDQVLDFFKSGG